MGLDIYISKKTASGEKCLIHWRKFYPLADWFKEHLYEGKLDREQRQIDYRVISSLRDTCESVLESENWKEKMRKELFPVSAEFVWTGQREHAYLDMIKTIAKDIEYADIPREGEELLIRISY